MTEISDKQYFIAFSNSVIEHLFTFENQSKMANEVKRVASFFYVQTPNKYFFIEPHFLFPLFQFLPRAVRIFLLQNFTLGHITKHKKYEEAANQVDEIRLMTKREMKDIFESYLYLEKIFDFTKSIVSHNLKSN